MRYIRTHFMVTALNMAVAGVLKAVIRSKPELHARYIDFLQEQAKHEIDRFQRLHKVKEETE